MQRNAVRAVKSAVPSIRHEHGFSGIDARSRYPRQSLIYCNKRICHRKKEEPLQLAMDIAGQPLTCHIVPMGRDVCLSLCGGQKAHIGCTVLAIPRPSLTGNGRSATVSVLNRTGHKDDVVAAEVAKAVAARRNCVVSCTCGIHIDNASPQLIDAIAAAPARIAERICKLLPPSAHAEDAVDRRGRIPAAYGPNGQ